MGKIDVLDHGFVKLENYLADDLSVVNSARVSFATEKNSMDQSDIGLIHYLMKNKHGSVFEHNFFRFHIKCPIFVAREWFRHRISSFNEMSMRYHQPELEFYTPEVFRTQVGKPGSYTFEDIDPESSFSIQSRMLMKKHFNASKDLYEHLADHEMAKELARVVVPVSAYTEFWWSLNARSLMNFLSLRNSPHAQFEIREYARIIEDEFSQVMPITYQAWTEADREAP